MAMSWFGKLFPSKVETSEKKGVPEGLWKKCPTCNAVLYATELERNLRVCPKCDYHIKLSARIRIDQFLDEEDRVELAKTVVAKDILKFRDSKKYKDRLVTTKKKTGEKDAMVVMRGKLYDMEIVMTVFEFGFIGGSMGAAVGEKFVQAVNECLKVRIPLVCFSMSGGARMQEGLMSLMQMAKTSAALAVLAEREIPFISILCDPTTGGVSASLAMLGDIIIAEPNALIGFAGPRVIEQTVGETLPEGFQRSEFLFEHGAIDMIIDRRELRDRVACLLAKLTHQPARPWDE